jgi:tRNA dimethylallyltransferase
MPVLFALVGATGIGKSELSLRLAEHYDAEIIGVDSRQIYKGFCIGTAQPDAASLVRVKHHLVDFLDPMSSFSAGGFCNKVKELLSANPERNYILVGGTGLYLQSLMLGLPQIPAVPEEVRLELENLAAREGADSLYKMAMAADPELVRNVEPNNVHRLVRIVEVFKATGRRLSEFQKEREGGIGLLPIFWLQRERDALYKRIDSRVDQMIQDGWVDEVNELAKDVPLTAPAWQSLGYRELLLVKTPAEMAEVVEEVKKKTRNYAKRQLTWFRWQVESTPIDMGKDPFSLIVRSYRA